MSTGHLKIVCLFVCGIVAVVVTNPSPTQAQSANNTWYSKIKTLFASNEEVRPEAKARYSLKGGTDLKALQIGDGKIYNRVKTPQPLINSNWTLPFKTENTERKFAQSESSTNSGLSSFRTSSFYLKDRPKITVVNRGNTSRRTSRSRCRLR